jgi:hypothetical protein
MFQFLLYDRILHKHILQGSRQFSRMSAAGRPDFPLRPVTGKTKLSRSVERKPVNQRIYNKNDVFGTIKNRWVIVTGATDCVLTKCTKKVTLRIMAWCQLFLFFSWASGYTTISNTLPINSIKDE